MVLLIENYVEIHTLIYTLLWKFILTNITLILLTEYDKIFIPIYYLIIDILM